MRVGPQRTNDVAEDFVTPVGGGHHGCRGHGGMSAVPRVINARDDVRVVRLVHLLIERLEPPSLLPWVGIREHRFDIPAAVRPAADIWTVVIPPMDAVKLLARGAGISGDQKKAQGECGCKLKPHRTMIAGM